MITAPDFLPLAMALLHNVWIAGVMYCAVKLIFALMGEERAHGRYVVAFAGLLITAPALPFSYFLLAYESPVATSASTQSAEVAMSSDLIESSAVEAVTFAIPTYTNAPESGFVRVDIPRVACIVWMCGVALMLVRLVRNVRATQRFRNECFAMEDPRARRVFEEAVEELGIRFRVQLLRAGEILQPAALGLVRPAVVLPMSLVTGLDEQQLRAVLLHELLHIRRHDYLFNLLQSIAEAVLFFNPFVWMLGRLARAERESACDVIAARHLGDSRQYARALLEAAAYTVADAGPLAAHLGADNSEGFAARLRRLVRPNRGSDLRLPLSGLLAFALLAGVLVCGTLFVTQRGAIVTAQLLTPEERVAAITEIDEAARMEDRGPMSLSGRVVDEQGNPVRERVSLMVRGPGYSLSTSVNRENGRFSARDFESGIAEVSADAEGYAPARVGPFSARDNADVSGIEIVLTPGISNVVHIQDEGGAPVPNAEIVGGHVVFEGTFSWSIRRTTDDRGELTVTGGEDYPIRLMAEHAGFQEDQRDIQIQPGKSHIWTLRAALPVEGVVTDKETGHPVSGATLHKLHRMELATNHGHSYGGGMEGSDAVATTDTRGRFVLDTLADGSEYSFSIRAEGYAQTLLGEVVAGEDIGEVQLNRPLSFSGRIELTPDWAPEEVSLATSVEVQESEHISVYRTADVVDGEFHFDDLFPGSWALRDNESRNRVTVELTESIDGFVYASPAKLIPVRVTIAAPPGYPAPEGDIVMMPVFQHPTKDQRLIRDTRRFPVVEGEANIEVPSDASAYYIDTDLNRYAGTEHVNPRGLPGFFLSRTELIVENGIRSPQVTVHAEPAGTVTVLVDHAPEDVERNWHVQALHVEPDHEKWKFSNEFDDFRRRVESGVVYSALPLEQTYRFHAKIGEGYVLSPNVTLDARNPIAEVVLRAGPAESLEVTVLNADGTPAASASARLECMVDGHSIGSHSGTTDAHGRVTLENIQPNADIEFQLSGSVIDDSNKLVAYARKTVMSFRSPVTLRLESL